MKLYEWCVKKLESHAISPISLLEELDGLGDIVVNFNAGSDRASIKYGDEVRSIYLQTSDDLIKSMKLRGVPFLVFDENAEGTVTHKDEETPYVVSSNEAEIDEAYRLGMGVVFYDPDKHFFDDLQLVETLAELVTGKHSTKMGRGFRFRECLGFLEE